MSESGNVIKRTKMTRPRCLSVCYDDSLPQVLVYLADSVNSIYWSINDGVIWSLVFNTTGERHCRQVFEVATDRSDDFWIIERSDDLGWHELFFTNIDMMDIWHPIMSIYLPQNSKILTYHTVD